MVNSALIRLLLFWNSYLIMYKSGHSNRKDNPMPHEDFSAMMMGHMQDTAVPVTSINDDMAVCMPEGPIIITKEQVMKFFDLVPKEE